MKVGTVKEIKAYEYRVGLTPDNVAAYLKAGHEVMVESGAGIVAGFEDAEYIAAGAVISESPAEIFEKCDMIVKVKEPLEEEYKYLREDLILYAYLHLAPNRQLTDALLNSNIKAVAFETIEDNKGGLPCLRPMSEIAGRLSIHEGAKYLECTYGGRGILLEGVPGVERGNVCIVGGGIAGTNAAKVALGLGAEVTVLDINLDRLAYLNDIFGNKITTLYSSEANIDRAISKADIVVGAVLIPGASTPKLIKKNHLSMMKKGAVIVDIAVDQGGCCETSEITYHDNPVFLKEGIVHYCVGNMPGAVPRTATLALANTTFPLGLAIANLGLEEACRRNSGLSKGVNIYKGICTCKKVAESLNIEYSPLEDFI